MNGPAFEEVIRDSPSGLNGANARQHHSSRANDERTESVYNWLFFLKSAADPPSTEDVSLGDLEEDGGNKKGPMRKDTETYLTRGDIRPCTAAHRAAYYIFTRAKRRRFAKGS